MNINSIRGMLTDEALKCFMEIVYVDEIDSTNAEAARRIDAGKRENWVLITTAQTAGRGRRGRVWLSPQDAGIYMSLVSRFNVSAELIAFSTVNTLFGSLITPESEVIL